MRIGIDIDETLTETEKSFDEVIKKYNVPFSKKYKDRWIPEEAQFLFDNYGKEILGDVELKKDVKESLEYLKSKGHELIVISARNTIYEKNSDKMTYDLIKKYQLPIDEVYLRQPTKSELAKELGIDIMIDDSIDVYNNMKRENIDCILFGDRIKTWHEVIEYIDRKEASNG